MKEYDQEVSKREERPIDKGWAWAVLFGCTFESFLLIGTLRAFGIYIVEFVITYNASASVISTMLSVQTLLYSGCSLFCIAIGERFNINRMFVMIGSVLATSGFLICSVSKNSTLLIFSMGGILGLACAFMHGPAVVMVGKYFERRRGMANALMNFGGSVGGFALPSLLRYFLDTFGLQGTLWLHAGLLLNIAVGATLLRPLSWFGKMQLDVKDTLCNTDDNGKSVITKQTYAKCNYQPVAREAHDTSFGVAGSVDALYMINKQKGSAGFAKQKYLAQMRGRKRTRSDSAAMRNIYDCTDDKCTENVSKVYQNFHGDMLGSLANIKIPSVSNIVDKSMHHINGKKEPNIMIKLLSDIIDKDLLKNRMFMLAVFASACGVVGSWLVPPYLPDHARDIGITTKQASILLTILGGTDMLNKVILAIVSDTHLIKRHVLVAFSLIVSGIACLLIQFYQTFWSLAIFSAVYGILNGTFYALYAVVIVDFVGIDNLSKGLAIITLTQGMSVIICTPIFGAIRDITSSYIPAFYIMGGTSVLGGVSLLLEPVVRKIESSRSDVQDDQNI